MEDRKSIAKEALIRISEEYLEEYFEYLDNLSLGKYKKAVLNVADMTLCDTETISFKNLQDAPKFSESERRELIEAFKTGNFNVILDPTIDAFAGREDFENLEYQRLIFSKSYAGQKSKLFVGEENLSEIDGTLTNNLISFFLEFMTLPKYASVLNTLRGEAILTRELSIRDLLYKKNPEFTFATYAPTYRRCINSLIEERKIEKPRFLMIEPAAPTNVKMAYYFLQRYTHKYDNEIVVVTRDEELIKFVKTDNLPVKLIWSELEKPDAKNQLCDFDIALGYKPFLYCLDYINTNNKNQTILDIMSNLHNHCSENGAVVFAENMQLFLPNTHPNQAERELNKIFLPLGWRVLDNGIPACLNTLENLEDLKKDFPDNSPLATEKLFDPSYFVIGKL